MKISNWKLAGLIILLILFLSFLALALELNYCHYLTTSAPPNSPPDYIKTGTLCRVNSIVVLPSYLVIALWSVIF
jgi:hypothetical protein